MLTERHSLFDASDMLETFDNNNGTSTTPTSTATSGQEESPLPDSGKFKFLKSYRKRMIRQGPKNNSICPQSLLCLLH